MKYKINPNTILNDIAGAIALAGLRDLRINLFGFNGFPSITVEKDEDSYQVFLRRGLSNEYSVEFYMTKEMAHKNAEAFKFKKDVDDQFFDLVQEHIAKLEGLSR